MKRFQIRLPSWHMKRLIWWSKAKGDSLSGMSGRIIQARIEANEAQIESMIADKAVDLGITPEEVKRRWLGDFDLSAFGEDEPDE